MGADRKMRLRKSMLLTQSLPMVRRRWRLQVPTDAPMLALLLKSNREASTFTLGDGYEHQRPLKSMSW